MVELASFNKGAGGKSLKTLFLGGFAASQSFVFGGAGHSSLLMAIYISGLNGLKVEDVGTVELRFVTIQCNPCILWLSGAAHLVCRSPPENNSLTDHAFQWTTQI